MKNVTWGAATPVSTGASVNSDVVQIPEGTAGTAWQVAWTGTTQGTVKLQASNDKAQWDDVTGITDSPAGSAGQNLWVVSNSFWLYYRIVFTRSGGTGNLSATYNHRSYKS